MNRRPIELKYTPQGGKERAYREFTLEPDYRSGGYWLYAWGVYGRYSVLAGQDMKRGLDHYDTVEEALAHLKESKIPKRKIFVAESRISANNYVNHLPGEDDPVPGGMYPDDY